MILHLGDFAYNFETNKGLMGDVFMRNIEPIAAQIPYMVYVPSALEIMGRLSELIC